MLGQEHPDALRLMINLAITLKQNGKFNEAEAMLRRCIEIERRVLGREHRWTLLSMNNLANLLRDKGKTQFEQLRPDGLSHSGVTEESVFHPLLKHDFGSLKECSYFIHARGGKIL